MRITYLAHHGILGQKWGDRNGPPYPLKSSSHSAREKIQGWKKSLNKSKTEGQPSNKRLTSGQKKVLIIGGIAVVAAVGLGYYAYKHPEIMKLGKDQTKKLLGRAAGDIFSDEKISKDSLNTYKPSEKAQQLSKTTGLKIKSKETSSREDSIITAERRNKLTQGNGRTPDEYINYCPHASINWVCRRLGLDTIPKPMKIGDEGGLSLAEACTPFRGVRPDKPPYRLKERKSGKEYMDSLGKAILSEHKNEGACGILQFRGTEEHNVGHFISWSIENGKVTFEDPATGNDALRQFNRMVSGTDLSRIVDVARIDNYTGVRNNVLRDFVESAN